MGAPPWCARRSITFWTCRRSANLCSPISTATPITGFIGKDNIPFHTVIWQAELLGVKSIYDEEQDRPIQLPYDVPANEFMNVEGAQFSKSRNWAIWLPDILDRYDPDAIRFYVASVMPETRDSDFSWPDFVSRNNDELVATWGNLANRVTSFAYRHWDGRVPDPGDLGPKDRALLADVEAGFEKVGAEIEAVHLRAGLQDALALAREVNGYLDRSPWFSVVKEDKAAAARTVYTALQAIDHLKTLFSPYLPFSSERLHRALGYDTSLFGESKIETIEGGERPHDVLTYDPAQASGEWAPERLAPGQALAEPKPLYTKLDPDTADAERERMSAGR